MITHTFREYLKSIKRLANPPKSFFPNLTFVLMRTERRYPNQAVFKVPLFFTKFDVANYLAEIYGVRSLSVSTFNLPRKWKKSKFLNAQFKVAIPSFKKAIVTLDHEFVYPPTVERSSITDENQQNRIDDGERLQSPKEYSKSLYAFENDFHEERSLMRTKLKSLTKTGYLSPDLLKEKKEREKLELPHERYIPQKKSIFREYK